MVSLNNTVMKPTKYKNAFVSCCCCCFIFCFLSSINYMYHSTFKTSPKIQILQSRIQFNPKNIGLDVGFISVSLSPVTTDQTFIIRLDERFSVYIKMGKTKWQYADNHEADKITESIRATVLTHCHAFAQTARVQSCSSTGNADRQRINWSQSSINVL